MLNFRTPRKLISFVKKEKQERKTQSGLCMGSLLLTKSLGVNTGLLLSLTLIITTVISKPFKLLNNCQQHTQCMHDLGAIITSKKEQNWTLKGSVLWLPKGYFTTAKGKKKISPQRYFLPQTRTVFILSALGSLPAREPQ